MSSIIFSFWPILLTGLSDYAPTATTPILCVGVIINVQDYLLRSLSAFNEYAAKNVAAPLVFYPLFCWHTGLTRCLV